MGSSGATVSKGLAQGPYVATRAGVEPTTLWLRVIDLTNAPPRCSRHCIIPTQRMVSAHNVRTSKQYYSGRIYYLYTVHIGLHIVYNS